MNQSIQCPVCGKDGIPDFHFEDVVCPCCGSDLSIYNRLREITAIQPAESNGKHRKKWLFLGTIILLLFLFFGCCIIYIRSARKDLSLNEQRVEIAELHNKVSLLQDSLQNLNGKFIQLGSAVNSIERSITDYRIYLVKNGDSFRKISRKQLGKEKRFEEIISLNNLVSSSLILPGDTLKIPKQ